MSGNVFGASVVFFFVFIFESDLNIKMIDARPIYPAAPR